MMASERNFEGYCMVFKKQTTEIVRGNNHQPDILKVKEEHKDKYKKQKFENADDLLQLLREEKNGQKQEYCIDYRIIEDDADDEYYYVFIYCDESLIEKWAELRNMDVPIDSKAAIKIAKKTLPNWLLAKRTALPPADSSDDDDAKYSTVDDNGLELVNWQKWDNIHVGFKSILHNTKDIDIFHNPPISHLLYLRILFDILTDDAELDGSGFEVQKYLDNKHHPLDKFYVTDQQQYHQQMKSAFDALKCVSCWKDSNTKFLDGVRNYYGEKVAFYFAFLLHYTNWLYPLAVIGTIWWFVEEANGDVYDIGSIFAILVIIIWSTLMIENWYRREWELRYRWGMMRYQHTEIPRSAFRGKYIISSVNGMRIETYDNKCLYWFKRIISICISFICVLLVVFVTIFIWGIQNQTRHMDEYVAIIIGMINSVQIQIFNTVYVKLARFLNDWEGHRLEEEYYNQLVIKRISFIVINSFYSLFYIAFFDDRDEYTDNEVRLKALRTQLIVLFLMAIFYQNTLECFCPVYMPRIRRCCCICCCGCCTSKHSQHTNEEEYQELIASGDRLNIEMEEESKENDKRIKMQAQLSESPDVLDNTAEIIVLHGYVTLFIVVFPLMPLLGVMNNAVELWVDKHNLVNTRRPVPWSAGGLGVWSTVLSIFAVVSIYSNLALVTFRTDLIIQFLEAMEEFFAEINGVYWTNEDMVENQVTFFFVSTTFFVFVIVGIRMCIPPITEETAEDIARQEICQRELLHIPTNRGRVEVEDVDL